MKSHPFTLTNQQCLSQQETHDVFENPGKPLLGFIFAWNFDMPCSLHFQTLLDLHCETYSLLHKQQ